MTEGFLRLRQSVTKSTGQRADELRSSGGKAYNGEYYAENEKQVIDFVHRNYGYVVNIERVKNKKAFHRLFKPRLQFSNRERANFYKQLSTLLDAGIPIVKGIEMVAERLSEKYKPICTRLTGTQCLYLSGLFAHIGFSYIHFFQCKTGTLFCRSVSVVGRKRNSSSADAAFRFQSIGESCNCSFLHVCGRQQGIIAAACKDSVSADAFPGNPADSPFLSGNTLYKADGSDAA